MQALDDEMCEQAITLMNLVTGIFVQFAMQRHHDLEDTYVVRHAQEPHVDLLGVYTLLEIDPQDGFRPPHQ